MPLEIEDLEDSVAGLNTRLDKFNLELEKINEDIVGNNQSISLANDAINKYEKQLKNIKNNREYTSLTKEIEYQNLEIQIAEKKKKENEANIIHKQEIINACQEQIDEKNNELGLKQKELNEIIKGETVFCATGITDGDLVKGGSFVNNEFYTDTFVTHTNSFKNVIKNRYPKLD